VALAATGQPYRLLSEAEWENACRAGTTTAYSFGDKITNAQAQYSEWGWGSGNQSVETGSFAVNKFGLYDMHSNVWEWCQDCWKDTYKGAPRDGSAWTTWDRIQRVLRGGSWFSDPSLLRSAYRNWNVADYRYYDIGFRVAKTVTH
jgi:formylglycine-generating enzyme required for sulfatase activity